MATKRSPRRHPVKKIRAVLVPGRRRPYASWTFLVVPEELAAEWGAGPIAVRGTLGGVPFRGTATRGEGALRMPVPRELRERAAVGPGDAVDVAIELDTDPRPIDLPDELRALFRDDPELATLYDRLPPSHRRAWATYVGGAKRQETRIRRVRKAVEGIRRGEFPR